MEFIVVILLVLILVAFMKLRDTQDKMSENLDSKISRLEMLLEQMMITLQQDEKTAETVVQEEVVRKENVIPIVTNVSDEGQQAVQPMEEEPEPLTTVAESLANMPEPAMERHASVMEAHAPVMETGEPAMEMQEPASQPTVELTPEEPVQAIAAVEEPTVEKPHEEIPQHEAAFESPKSKFNYEEFIGENLFGKIGILIFVIGIGFFVKYAIDNNWINETMRTALGFAIGAGMLALAHKLKDNYRAFSSLLAGGACAVFYVTVAVAFHYYSLFSQSVAFIILVSVTVLMISISLLYNRRELAVTALVGGFLAPFIASTGEGNYAFLLVYLGILNLGMAVLAMYRKWSELPVCCFVFTAFILTVFEQPAEGTSDVYRFVFGIVFCIIITLTTFRLLHAEESPLMRIPLTGLLFINGFFCLYNTSETAFFLNNSEGYCCIFLALLHLVLWLWLRRKGEERTLLGELLLGLTLIFATIALPMFFEGDLLRLFWAMEMVLLLGLYVKSQNRIYAYATAIAVCLTSIGVVDMVFDWTAESTHIFFNGTFMTWFFTGLSYVAFAYLMQRNRDVVDAMYSPWNTIMYVVGLFLTYLSVCMELDMHITAGYNEKACLFFTSVYLLLVTYLFRHRFDMERYSMAWKVLLSVWVLINSCFSFLFTYVSFFFWANVLNWLSIITLVANIVYIGYRYYAEVEHPRRSFNIFLCVVSTLTWLSMIRLFLLHIGISDFSTAMSLGVSVAAFVQMYLGMRLHRKELRLFSIISFVLVLVKLAFYDVWQMPALGRIIVFIILGLLLLTLSFLYQRLKDVLFKDDVEREKEMEQTDV